MHVETAFQNQGCTIKLPLCWCTQIRSKRIVSYMVYTHIVVILLLIICGCKHHYLRPLFEVFEFQDAHLVRHNVKLSKCQSLTFDCMFNRDASRLRSSVFPLGQDVFQLQKKAA